MRFLQDTDYSTLIRNEILTLLITDFNDAKLLAAEDMAVAQMKNYIAGRYDVTKVFDSTIMSTRNYHIVMLTIDITLYHLYANNSEIDTPSHREQRYQDAIDWLRDAGKGDLTADLPLITDADTGEEISNIRIWSKYEPDNHRW